MNACYDDCSESYGDPQCKAFCIAHGFRTGQCDPFTGDPKHLKCCCGKDVN